MNKSGFKKRKKTRKSKINRIQIRENSIPIFY